MAIPSTYPGLSPVISISTAADGYFHVFYCQSIFWHLTTGATSTWALAVLQSSAVAGSTVAWPLIGTSTQSVFLGGSTAALIGPGPICYPINNFVYGITVPTISGGLVQIVKGFPPAGAHSYYTT